MGQQERLHLIKGSIQFQLLNSPKNPDIKKPLNLLSKIRNDPAIQIINEGGLFGQGFADDCAALIGGEET